MDTKEQLVAVNQRLPHEDLIRCGNDIELLGCILTRNYAAKDIANCILGWDKTTVYWMQLQIDILFGIVKVKQVN